MRLNKASFREAKEALEFFLKFTSSRMVMFMRTFKIFTEANKMCFREKQGVPEFLRNFLLLQQMLHACVSKR